MTCFFLRIDQQMNFLYLPQTSFLTLSVIVSRLYLPLTRPSVLELRANLSWLKY